MQVGEVLRGEAQFFGISFLVGMGLVLVYDVFRIFRRVIKHGTVWIGIEDIFFWLLCTVVVFLLFYGENDGMMRMFSFVGILLGMGTYLALFSYFIVRFFVWLFGGILKQIQKIGRVLFRPFWKLFRKILLFLKKWLKKCCKAIKMSLSKW